MPNSGERRNTSQIEVYSIQLNSNPTSYHDETPIGDDGVHTEIVRSTSGATVEAWREDSLSETHDTVQDIWLAEKSAITASNHAMIQWIKSLENSSWFQHVYGPIIVALATASPTIITLLPQHNSILEPEYWYEILIPLFIHYACILAPLNIIRVSMLMNLDILFTWKRCLKLSMQFFLAFGIPYVLLHIVWVRILGLRHPVPFTGHICMLSAIVPMAVSMWLLFPKDLRKNNNPFRKQILFYLMFGPSGIIIIMEYSIVTALFDAIPIEFQWCMACFLPVVKEFNIWILTKLIYKIAGGKTLPATLFGVCYGYCYILEYGHNTFIYSNCFFGL